MTGLKNVTVTPSGMPPCVGITVSAQATYPTEIIAGQEMGLIPGGHTVVGSYDVGDRWPHWVLLSPYWAGTTAVSESQYRETMGRAGNVESPGNHPANLVSYPGAEKYMSERGRGLRLLTSAEWEVAARGPAVNMREAMKRETGIFSSRDFFEWAAGRFENFVFGVLANPLMSNTGAFLELVAQDLPFWGWRVYGTSSGRLTHDEAWYDQQTMAPVDWGPANGYGLKGMAGGVWEWVKDWYEENVYLLGGVNPSGPKDGAQRVVRNWHWHSSCSRNMYAAEFTCFDPDDGGHFIGFRPAAPHNSPK